MVCPPQRFLMRFYPGLTTQLFPVNLGFNGLQYLPGQAFPCQFVQNLITQPVHQKGVRVELVEFGQLHQLFAGGLADVVLDAIE